MAALPWLFIELCYGVLCVLLSCYFIYLIISGYEDMTEDIKISVASFTAFLIGLSGIVTENYLNHCFSVGNWDAREKITLFFLQIFYENMIK